MSVRIVRPGDTITKTPSEKLVIHFDWTAWLQELDATATISSSTFTLPVSQDDDLAVDNAGIVTGSLLSKCRITGGIDGHDAILRNVIITGESTPQTGDKWITIHIRKYPKT